MSLEFTLVRRAIRLAVIDGPDADDNPDILQAQGSVLFEPVIKKGDSIQVQTRAGSETYALAPIECPINDGIISHRGQDGVKLPAGGEAANPSLIRWKATFSRMQAGGKSFTLAPVIFDAVPGGEIDLTMVAPVAGAPEGIVRGPRGTSLESIIVDGSELVFTAVDDAGSFEIARIPLDEMVRAEAEAAADGVRDALAVDVNAAQSARDVAEGHANRAATSESNAATSETNAKQSESNAGDYAAVATTAATEAVDAMDSVSDIIGANYATHEYVDSGLSIKADEHDVASIRDRLSAIEPVDSEHSEGTEWAHAAGDGSRLPLGYTPEGRLDDFARKVWSEDVVGLHEVPYDRQYVRAYTTPEGHMLAAIHRDGTVEIPQLKANIPTRPDGENISIREKYRHTDGTLAPVMADTAHIAGWGSSSMEGMTSAITGALSGLPTTYHNFAKGGEWIEHNAARMGAIPALVEPVVIPASGSVAVTVGNVPANANMRPFTGHLSGVHGTLSSTTTDFTFTRTTPGDPITLSGTTEFIPDIDPDVLNHTTILQLGKNNFVVPTVVEDVSRISSTMLAYLRPLMPRVLILGHHANANWGTEAYSYMRDRLARVNDNMRALAGDDHFIDVHRIVTGDEIWTRTGITPTAEDLEAQSLGILAPSLRVDGAHFNGATNQALADIIRERIDYLNWY